MKNKKIKVDTSKIVSSKLQPVHVSIHMKENPEWKKQVAVCKKELEKLNKILAFTIETK